MQAPQIIVLVIYGLTALSAVFVWGHDKDTGKFLTSIVAIAIMFALLIWGGFWDTCVVLPSTSAV